ncbi:surface lipoprotein assembly modifier [Sphingomonas koreensis]
MPVLAQNLGEQDTRLRLDQQMEGQKRNTEAELLEEADALDGSPTSLEIDGATYSVGDNVDDMGKALYITIGRRKWHDARRFLDAYARYPDHDPMLVLYAKGALARHDGKLGAAEHHYRELVARKADFIPGRLELARVLFENRKDREARRAFETVRAQLLAQGDQSRGVVATVDAFLAALKQRRGWQGAIAIGPGYSTNLNQSSASYTCLLAGTDGTCLLERKVPDPIKATGINFEATLGRNLPLAGHHGVRVSALLFGDIYPSEHDYSQATLIARLGYQYQSARDTLTLGPSFEAGSFGSSLLYDARGAHAAWQHAIAANLLTRVETNYRDYRYRQRSFVSQNGPLADVSLTVFYVPSPNWTLFGGPDFAAKDTPAAVDAYRQWGGRLGVSKAFGTRASLLLIGSYRRREHRAYSELFAARRGDDQYNVTAIARMPALQFARLVPELVLQHTRVVSNIDWLYSYKRTTASVRLSHVF